MVDSNMGSYSKFKSKISFLKIGLFLSVTTALCSAAQAQIQATDRFDPDPLGTGVVPTYSANLSLPNISADQIASDVESRFDPLTGRTEYLAQDFDPFEQNTRIAGSARLRSAASGISREGASLTGGAFLDITVLYSSASRDPWDSKGLEHAVYMNGQPVDVLTYDAQTLDCKQDVSYVSYDDSYYRGDSYGYVGGLYRPLPRYRGASSYYRQCDQIRYGAWRGLRDRYVNYSGYDRRVRNRGRTNSSSFDFARRQIDLNAIADRNRESDAAQTRDRRLERELALQLRDQTAVSSRNVIRPDMLGDRRLTNVTSGVDPRPLGTSAVSTLTTGAGTSPVPASRVRTAPPVRPQIATTGQYDRFIEQRDRLDRREQVRQLPTRGGTPRLTNATPRISNATPRLSNAVPRLTTPRTATTPRTPPARPAITPRQTERRTIPSRQNQVRTQNEPRGVSTRTPSRHVPYRCRAHAQTR